MWLDLGGGKMTAHWSIVVAGILVAGALVATNRTQISSSSNGVWEHNTLTGALRYCWTTLSKEEMSMFMNVEMQKLRKAGFSEDEINDWLDRQDLGGMPTCSPWKR